MKQDFDFTTKAQEIVYIVSRIGFAMRRAEFRARIERAAFDLFEAVALRDFERVLSFVVVLEGYVQVGVSLYEIETVNAQSLLHELSAFQSAIRQKYCIDGLPIADSPAIRQDAAIASAIPNEPVDESFEDSDDGMTSIASTIRQSAILDKVRAMTAQNGSSFVSGCRMKDLLLAFPQVSERTLRNDLQRLLAQGSVERLGSGGSNSFYVIK